jgi:hypothetical protein
MTGQCGQHAVAEEVAFLDEALRLRPRSKLARVNLGVTALHTATRHSPMNSR